MTTETRKLSVVLVSVLFLSTALAASGSAQTRGRSLPRDPRTDSTNLMPAGIAYCEGTRHPAGTIAEGQSWNGSKAVHAGHGYPWFGIGLYDGRKEIFDKIRGKWVKFYVDTKGGGFSVALTDGKTRAFHWLTLGNKDYDSSEWTRLSVTAKVPEMEFERPSLTFYPVGKNKDVPYDNFRLYVLGTEPPELLAPLDRTWNPNLKNLVTDPSIEQSGTGATFPPGWNLEAGGVRLVTEQAHTGKISMKLLADSRVGSPILDLRKEVPVRVHFWVRGRGTLSVGALDLDEMGTPLMRGASEPGDWMVRNLTLQDKWVKVEATSRSYEKNARKRRIDFISGKDSEVFIDDIQVLRDMKQFPPVAAAQNPFKSTFRSDEAELALLVNGSPVAGGEGAISGPSVMIIKAVPKAGAQRVLISGAAEFEDGGTAPADGHWKFTTKDPGSAAFQLNYDDSAWKGVETDAGATTMSAVAAGRSVWFRRVVLWNVTSYVAPILKELPIDRGKSDWIIFTLNPPVATKIKSYELVVDIPEACELVTYSGRGAYFRTPTDFILCDQRVRHGGLSYKRYRLTYPPGEIRGMPGAIGGGNSVISMALIRQNDGMPYDEAAVYLHRIANGNVVDLPTKIDLVHVPMDGTAPKKMMVHMWAMPYVVGNPPAPQINIEAADVLMESYIPCGITHWAWPTRVEKYVTDTTYGRKWAEKCKKLGIKMMPTYHNFPFIASHNERSWPDEISPAYRVARKAPGAVVRHGKNKMADGLPENLFISVGWLLSDASDQYWKLLRDEYATKARRLEEATGMEFYGYTWDYEFEVGVYDPITLKLFAKRQNITEPLTEELVKRKYSGQWTTFSRWACRQMIQKTYDRVVKPLGYRFHVYYGEGRPFDPGNCDIISAYGITQNVPGLMPSVRAEYESVKRGIDRDPRIRFIGLLQPDIQYAHRRRPFHWQELRNNMVKRAVVTQGGGPAIWTSLDGGCPGMTYGCAASSRILAKWEDYFIGFEPVFAGEELERIVKFDPQPADVVLLKKGAKGLLLIFGGEPEAQPDTVNTTLTYAGGKSESLRLAPMGIEIREILLP